MTRPSDIGKSLISKQSRRRSATKLKGVLWLSHLLWINDLSLAQFDSDYAPKSDGGGSTSGIAYRWERGDRIPTARSVHRIETLLHNTAWVYDLPLFPFLDTTDLSAQRIRKLLARYMGYASWHEWENVGRPNNSYYHLLSLFEERNSDELLCSCDISRFITTLALVRTADTENDVDAFLRHMGNAFRMYPLISKIPWIYPHRSMLIDCLQEVNCRCPSLNVWLDPDLSQLETLVHAEQLRGNRSGLLTLTDNAGRTSVDVNPVRKLPHDLLR